MKKIIAAAAGLMMVGVSASSAFAVENIFGGYWRVRMYSQVDMDGMDSGTVAKTDTRTRLYYTAKFNDNFKFVNKFEWNSTFGDNKGGDIGADGMGILRIKNSYADFKAGGLHVKLGTQGASIARGFIFADDFSGAVVSTKAGDNVTLPFAWIKVDETEGDPQEEYDIYAVLPKVKMDAITIKPYLVFAKEEGEDTNIYWAGADVNVKMDAASVWATGIYQTGEVGGSDISAFLVAAGAKAGPVHGQAFFATGDDDAADGDRDDFFGAPGNSYYWSEIMGLGTFDNTDSAGSPDDNITNIYAVNVGFKVKPMDKLTVGADVWYASLVEDNAAGETDLGIEFDVKATYAIMDNLKLDLIAAYLLAGDATGDEDPIEVGARVSLSF